MSIITNLELQNKFNTATKNSLNRHTLITFEIREIEEHINNIPANTRAFRKMTYTSTVNVSKKIFDFSGIYIDRKIFNESFYQYLNNGTQITIERLYNDNDERYRHKQNSADQAIEFFKYYQWLKTQLLTPQKLEDKDSLPVKQKLLALHYLGLDTSANDNNKCAEILGTILGVGSENIRKSLSHLYAGKNNNVRTKNNLEKVKQLFDSQGLTDISNRIKSDIENL
jgi:hypothetical protein